ncbi:hypothetical protein U1Q18_024001 [Sarracenia purpurea var. burkii]
MKKGNFGAEAFGFFFLSDLAWAYHKRKKQSFGDHRGSGADRSGGFGTETVKRRINVKWSCFCLTSPATWESRCRGVVTGGECEVDRRFSLKKEKEGFRWRKQRRSCLVAEVMCSAKSVWVENRFVSKPNKRDFRKATVIKLEGFASAQKSRAAKDLIRFEEILRNYSVRRSFKAIIRCGRVLIVCGAIVNCLESKQLIW